MLQRVCSDARAAGDVGFALVLERLRLDTAFQGPRCSSDPHPAACLPAPQSK